MKEKVAVVLVFTLHTLSTTCFAQSTRFSDFNCSSSTDEITPCFFSNECQRSSLRLQCISGFLIPNGGINLNLADAIKFESFSIIISTPDRINSNLLKLYSRGIPIISVDLRTNPRNQFVIINHLTVPSAKFSLNFLRLPKNGRQNIFISITKNEIKVNCGNIQKTQIIGSLRLDQLYFDSFSLFTKFADDNANCFTSAHINDMLLFTSDTSLPIHTTTTLNGLIPCQSVLYSSQFPVSGKQKRFAVLQLANDASGSTNAPSTGGSNTVAIAVGATVGGVALIGLIVGLVFLIRCIRTKRALRGTYEPNSMEQKNVGISMATMLKPPPEERLI